MQPINLSTSDLARFWSKVDKTSTCWLWTGRTHDGYGRFELGRKSLRAHRVSFTLAGGEIPEGLVLDHICRVRNCVNPEHLRAVDNKANVLAGIGLSALNARKTHCKRGHEFTTENTRVNVNGARICRACESEKNRKRNQNPPTCPTCGRVVRGRNLQRHMRTHSASTGGSNV